MSDLAASLNALPGLAVPGALAPAMPFVPVSLTAPPAYRFVAALLYAAGAEAGAVFAAGAAAGLVYGGGAVRGQLTTE